eukprot:scaffold100_cov122-Isochrysis_galbana.AAC.3
MRVPPAHARHSQPDWRLPLHLTRQADRATIQHQRQVDPHVPLAARLLQRWSYNWARGVQHRIEPTHQLLRSRNSLGPIKPELDIVVGGKAPAGGDPVGHARVVLVPVLFQNRTVEVEGLRRRETAPRVQVVGSSQAGRVTQHNGGARIAEQHEGALERGRRGRVQAFQQQATELARGPTESRVYDSGKQPSRGTRRCVGLNPVTPQRADGMRTEPRVSDPRPMAQQPSATETAAPAEEPPGTRPPPARSYGFLGVP